MKYVYTFKYDVKFTCKKVKLAYLDIAKKFSKIYNIQYCKISV